MRSISFHEKYVGALEKLAQSSGFGWTSPTVGVSYPRPSVGDVLSYIGVAQARGIGTPNERKDAFGRIINSGLTNTSPAENALRMISGGLLARSITGAFTNNRFLKGLGAGIGAVSSIRKY